VSNVTVISDAEFAAAVLEADRPVLVYLWASWCGPCRLVSPAIDWISQQYVDRLKVVKMEIDPNPETVKTYRVEGVPAFRLIDDRELVYSYEGAITKDKLAAAIEPFLGN
jgi:thioredoxin 1